MSKENFEVDEVKLSKMKVNILKIERENAKTGKFKKTEMVDRIVGIIKEELRAKNF